ncbi:MAG: hypothetical protein AB7L66_04580 [Gemmatimonadales bacterium]
MIRVLAYAWAAPWSAVGLLFAPFTAGAGGVVRLRRGVVEIGGGPVVPRVLARLLPGGAAAVTLGHVVLGTDEHALMVTRDHERVHVRQYERWGPLFPLLYGLASLTAAARGGHYYRDNRFEREARDLSR